MGNNHTNDNNALDSDLLDLLEDDVLYESDEEESDKEKGDEKKEINEDALKEHSSKLKTLLSQRSDYLKKVLSKEKPELSFKVVETMKFWEKPVDKEDKFKYREKLSVNYWALYRDMASNMCNGSFSEYKNRMIKYGLIDLDYLTESQQKLISKIDKINKSTKTDSIFLSNEWFHGISQGKIPPSVLDETKIKRKGPNKERIENKKGQLEAEIKSAKLKIETILSYESEFKDCIDNVTKHNKYPKSNDSELIEPYASSQRESITNMLEVGRKLLVLDKQLGTNYRTIEKLKCELERLEQALEKGENFIDGNELILSEFSSFRQMVKMCGGRQGNHFPILHKSYFLGDALNIATKQNVLKIIGDVEKLDPMMFYRTYKGESHRIFPYIIMVPSYGSRGVCWEPFSRSNRATSKGRIVLPMYPKNLKLAVLSSIADIRWQIAKAKAQHYWMEEGLTGHYYEYYMSEKLKGNIKSHFINDYILWINWESNGMQKLNKNARPVFWRFTPFPQEIKESLQNRGFYYRDLYKKDQRKSKSDGY